VHATAQVEDADAPLARDQLAQGDVDRLALRARAGQLLRLAQHLVVDLDVRPHARKLTPIKV
jgi:hypothetical protein